MQPLEREPFVCACGRPKAEAAYTVYRSATRRSVYRRCQCGLEWTEVDTPIEHADPITGDEVLEVHEHLKRADWSIAELLHP